MIRRGFAFSRRVIGCLALGLIAGLGAAETAGAQAPAHVHGTARLSLIIEGGVVRAEFAGPAASLVGFEHAPRTDAERETLALAVQNLEIGDAMIRFNTRAGCRLVKADVDARLGTARRQRASGHADIKASYRFACDWPERLDSAALGFFVGFPVLHRVLATYRITAGRGGAELTPGNQLISFIPF